LPILGQPLRDPDREAAQLEEQQDAPLVLRSSANKAHARASVEAAISRLRAEMREIAQSALSEAERREALEQLYLRNAKLFLKESAERENTPLTAAEAAEKLELLMYEAALDLAPDEKTREEIIAGAPQHLKLEPHRPVLIAPRSTRSKIVVTREAEKEGGITPWWKTTRFDTEALDLSEVAESPVEQLEPPEENEVAKEELAPAVAALSDEKATVEMHDDATILRDVETASGDLVLFDALHIWIGGAVQYEGQIYSDLLNAREGGGSERNTLMRRGEVVLRSTLFDLGEVKLQYDLDAEIWRDLNYRLVDSDTARTLTIGNQKEPMSQENMLGNKFSAPQERSAPTSAFGQYRSMGVTLNSWFLSEEGDSFLGIGDAEQSAVTAAFGIYGKDIENTNDTDLAATGRLTWGRVREDGTGLHLGLSGTWRHGEFDSINPRPGLAQLDRITLARFDADTAKVLGGEWLYTRGSLHASSEVYLADYSGDDIDARGFGGFIEVGYYLTGEHRLYRPKWGLWAPLQVGARNVFEVFGRLSYTYGDSDEAASNDLGTVTIGGSWYRHKFRTSLNLVYGTVDRDVAGEDTGYGASLRVQYLF
jgi:phosphate-selective porin